MSQKTIAEMIIASRTVESDKWSTYERAALIELDRRGIETLDAVLLYRDPSDPKSQWVAWLAETIVWVIGKIRAGHHREAIRGTWRMADYAGRLGGLGGVWPGGGAFSDAFIAFRNHFEAYIPR